MTTDSATGSFVGTRYEVVETVHESERSTILQARDVADGSMVALKVRPVGRGPYALPPVGEVSILLRVEPHRGLPVVRDDFFLPGGARYVIVTDWIDGKDLERVLAEEPKHRLKLGSVVEIVSQAADILDHLHRQRPVVVHGDVKPSNLILASSGFVCLVDFDVASTGSFRRPAGSRGFLAPEAAAGGSVTPSIDVYGLAATAVALMTGEPPALVGPAPEMKADASGEMTVLRRALSIDPTQRPTTAGALARQLRECLPEPAAERSSS